MWVLAVHLLRLVRGCCNSETLRNLSISEPLAHILASLFLQMSTELSTAMGSPGSLEKVTSCPCFHLFDAVPVAPAGRGWVSQPSQRDSQRDRLADLVTMGACIGGNTETTRWDVEYWSIGWYGSMSLQWEYRERVMFVWTLYTYRILICNSLICVCKLILLGLELHWEYITTSTHVLTGGSWSWDCLKD